MSRLIDADALIESFRKCYNGHLEMENSDSMMTFRSICRIINNQPTTYDPDKVVDQLKGLHEGYKCTDNEFQRGAKAGAHYVLNRAIDIVKGGEND